MGVKITLSRPIGFTVVPVLALLWQLLGMASLLFHIRMSPEKLASLPVGMQQVILATPAWLNIAYAVAMVSGLFGVIGLLLRKRWAVPMLALSLLGTAVDFIATLAFTPAWELIGPVGLVMPIIVLGVAWFLLLLACEFSARDWLD